MDNMRVIKKYIEKCNMLSSLLGEFVYKYNATVMEAGKTYYLKDLYKKEKLLNELIGELTLNGLEVDIDKVEYSGDKIIKKDGKDYIMCYGLKGHKSIKDMVVKFPSITQKKSVVMETLKDAEEFDRNAQNEMKYTYIDERIMYLIGAMDNVCRKMSYYFS